MEKEDDNKSEYSDWPHARLVAEADLRYKGFGVIVEATHQLKISVETLDQNLSGLLTAIHALDRKLLWFTIAIFLLTVVQVIFIFIKP